VDEVAILGKFADLVSDDILKHLRIRNSIFVPNRSFSVYVPYDSIENRFAVPVFGNRFLLRAEERTEPRNQYELMHKAGIRTPQRFASAGEIDRLVIVKASEAQRKYERAFFFAASQEEFERKGAEMVGEGRLTEEGLRQAVIEEVITGAQFNFNFFYSPLSQEIELMGIDTRRQTNLDGLLRLPAPQQAEILKHAAVKNIEVGHIASTLRESLLEKVFWAAERLVETCKKEYAPGLIGPFALQGAITSEEGKEDLVLFDLSFRVPGSPGIAATPYTTYTYGYPVSIGRRLAQEVKQAVKQNRLSEVLT
jgi:5-formaminoimidazole-4-carboxamide-1-(beta)-D-ribofuranosyl 5'-monophosphate synthetase